MVAVSGSCARVNSRGDLLNGSTSTRLRGRCSGRGRIAGRAPHTFVICDSSSGTIPPTGKIGCCLTLGGGNIPTILRVCPSNNRN